MNLLTRLIGYSVLLLFLFLAAALGAQAWLHQQTRRLQAEGVEAKRAQFNALLPLVTPAGGHWTTGDAPRLGAMCGGRVTVFTGPPPAPPADPNLLSFDQVLPDSALVPVTARVTFTPAPVTRLLALYQRVTIGLLILGFVLLGAGGFLGVIAWRSRNPAPAADGTPESAARDLSGFTRLAARSVAQTEALARERDVRRLAEEDALLKQRLLNQALEGHARLGHDLHDGLIQSLYAAGLTIESARRLIPGEPAEADRQLAQCVANLNATIRDVRAYITGLAPEQLRQSGFAQAVESIVQELRGGRPVNFDLRLDDGAIAALLPDQATELLQVVREAISNSLRHGGASFVTVRVHRQDRDLCLLVQDNGTGFDPAKVGAGGHGLGNLRARASRLAADLRVESSPGAGTRVILTLHLPA
ncbi:MAG: sensor histidine kinase [Verrucomicrobia bacterium]|nr:sensor histidine kinase [Verrucomicrobiota bacterium]